MGDEVAWPGDAWRMADLEHATAPPGTLAPGDPTALAEILFTSGATAEPKGVRITHRNLLANLNPVEGEIRRYRAAPDADAEFVRVKQQWRDILDCVAQGLSNKEIGRALWLFTGPGPAPSEPSALSRPSRLRCWKC